MKESGFRRLGEIVAGLMVEIEAAIVARDERTAAAAREELLDAEHRQRLAATAERMRRHG